MLIKPQELNQARLYTIESRIKENEDLKLAEVNFLKETLKKLIYAIEQSQIPAIKTMAGHGQSQHNNLPSLSKSRLPTREKDGKPGSSGGFFGQKRSLALADSGEDAGLISFHRGSRDLSPKASRDKNDLSHVAPDVLFLKRLLYLKASIDNEPTVSTYAVPFQEEKLRDRASPEQLMLNTAAVTSQRDSEHPWSPKAINAEYHLGEYPLSSQSKRYGGAHDSLARTQDLLDFKAEEFGKRVSTTNPQKNRRQIVSKGISSPITQHTDRARNF